AARISQIPPHRGPLRGPASGFAHSLLRLLDLSAVSFRHRLNGPSGLRYLRAFGGPAEYNRGGGIERPLRHAAAGAYLLEDDRPLVPLTRARLLQGRSAEFILSPRFFAMSVFKVFLENPDSQREAFLDDARCWVLGVLHNLRFRDPHSGTEIPLAIDHQQDV